MPRAIFKSATYGTMHLTVAILVAFAVTRSWVAALSVGILEPLVQTVCYNIHEHLWTRADERSASSQQIAH